MTKLKLVIASTALILGGLAASAFAQGKDGKDRKAFHEAKKAEMLAKFDANKDGKLDDAERAVMRDAKIEQRFAKLDANKDGVVTLAEMKANAPKGHKGMRHGRHRGFGKRGPSK